MGPRPPGSDAHARVLSFIEGQCRKFSDDVRIESFMARAVSGRVRCANVIARLPGPGRKVLLGTHFDTRWIADRDPDPARRGEPIPGVNDGGSGTAVLLALGRAARAAGCRDDLIFAFFDAEDLGGIAGNPYALGAIQYVRRGGLPDEAVILDMVGGLDMSLSVDLNSIAHEPSWNLTQEILSAGQAAGLAPFRRLRGAYIGCDHTPFQRAGVAAALLIDINYPQWHMHADTLDACCKESLGAVGQVLLGRIIDNAPPVG